MLLFVNCTLLHRTQIYNALLCSQLDLCGFIILQNCKTYWYMEKNTVIERALKADQFACSTFAP